MATPQAVRQVDGCRLHLVGTIAGFVPDGDAVRAALTAEDADVVALGIPPEDLEGLHALQEDPDIELPGPDPQSERLFEHLGRFGGTRVPSPDLQAAFDWARANDVPLEALDLDDEAHSHLYIRTVGFRHAVRSGFILKKILKEEFPQDDPHDLARAWDAYQNRLKPLKAVEAAREAHMAKRLRAVCVGHQRVLAVLPVARFDGVLERLGAD